MKLVLPSTILLSFVACSSNNSEKPNIILINIDDLGWSDLSFQGSEYYETPNIDKLRSQGMYFPNGYAAASNSAPSRASLMTGVYTPRHGVYTVNPPDRGKAIDRKFIASENNLTPDSKFKLLPEILKESGYITCHVGKWHLGDNPTTQGMDVNIGGYISGHPKSYFSPYKNPYLKDGEDGEFLTDRITSEAIEFLKNRDTSKPFFLYYAPYAVHTPLQPKKKIENKYKNKEKTDAHFNSKYAALIESVDVNLGRLLNFTESQNLNDNTLIIFTSDNGGLYKVSHQWPLRAGKGSFYEGGIRVPFIVKWGEKIDHGTTNNSLVSQLDIMPTILEIADIKEPEYKIDGISIVNQLFNDNQPLLNRTIFWHFPAYLEGGHEECFDVKFRARPQSVVRKGDWKLIHHYENDSLELFNLKDDLAETKNIYNENPEKLEELKSELSLWIKKYNAPIDFELNPMWGGK